MADQQRKVSLIFEANTNQAKQDINNLFAALQRVQAMPSTLIDPTNIKNASQAALELQGHLQRAVNIDTGKLDLSRFSASLTAANTSLDKYKKTLVDSGPAGENAFKQVMRGINSAETSTIRLTKGMRDFVNTMKNTVKWQFSSSLMHGFMGAVQSAYGYAKALDASLNNIRIVTGQSSEEMARFAIEANRSAQALSTTTTRYAEASLIFYQQGLSDKAVKERTDAVIKMANVTGEAAADVSSYMTAIWNNFDDGSKSIEYYADVITKLGAATAASSEEIAGGLEKFAAIGNTIGLSYEYATAMITTIVDKTRQSEDIVGTALKTILARVQGLNLGETLDDGTTMNKYSEALSKVGINIKTASGEIKSMDTILDELGSKWQTLSKDTQIALAQVVGGVRQYNQIIALMDNWSAFESNVNLAETASGSLDEQANIYAESWEAARNRVTTAAQGIYDALINNDVFIKLDNIFTHLLNTINGVVKGMGGMMPILGTIGSFITQKVAKEVPVMLNNAAQNIAILSGKAQNKALGTQQEITASATDLRELYATSDPKAAAEYETIRRVSVMREKLIANQHKMNSQEIEHYESLIRNEEALGAIFAEHQGILGTIEKENQALKEQAVLKATENLTEAGESGYDDNPEEVKEIQFNGETIEIEKKKDLYDKAYEEAYNKLIESLNKDKEELETILNEKKLDDPKEQMKYDRIQARIDQYEKGSLKTQDFWNEVKRMTLESLKAKLKEPATNIVEASTKLGNFKGIQSEIKSLFDSNTFKNAENKTEVLKQKFENLKTALKLSGDEDGVKEVTRAIENLGDKADLTEDDINNINAALDKLVEKQGKVVQGAQKAFIQEGGSVTDANNLAQSGEKQGHLEGRTDRPPEPPKIPEKNIEITERLTEAAGMAMSVYGSFNAILSAHTVLVDENAGAMEKLGSVIGGLISLMQTANSITNLLNNSTLFQNLIAKNLTKNMDAEAAKIIQNTYLKEGMAAASAKAAEMNQKLNKTMNASIWGLIATAVLTVIAAFISWHKKEKEMRKEMAEEAIEEANAINEEVKANEALINSYERAVYLYEKGEGSKDDIRKATEELCEVYDIENEQLLLQAERYDDITRAIREKRKEELKDSIGDNKIAISSQSQVLEDAFRDPFYSQFKFGEAISDILTEVGIKKSSSEYKALHTVYDSQNFEALKLIGVSEAPLEKGNARNDVSLKITTEDTTEGILQQYEEALRLKTSLEEYAKDNDLTDEIVDWTAYKALEKFINGISEEAEAYLEIQKALENSYFQISVLDVIDSNKTPETLDEYYDIENKLIELINENEDLNYLNIEQKRELARQALEQEQLYASNFAKTATLLEQASAASGLSVEALKEYYNSLTTDEERKLFFSINFNTARSKEVLKEQLDVLKATAANDSIEVKLEIVNTAIKNYKEGMSVEELKTYREKSGIAWGTDGYIDYSEFVGKSEAERKNYLQSLLPSVEDQNKANEKELSELQGYLDTLTAQQEDISSIIYSKDSKVGNTEGLFKKLISLDPTDQEAYDKEINSIIEANPNAGLTSEYLKNWVELWHSLLAINNEIDTLNANKATLEDENDLSNAYQKVEKQQKILELNKELQTLQSGDTINAENYETLVDYFGESGLQDAFIETAEGTYQLKEGLDGIKLSWQDLANATNANGNLLFDSEQLANQITSIYDLTEAFEQGKIELEDFEARSVELIANLADKATSLEELDGIASAFGLTQDNEVYTQNLIRLAENYDSCAEVVQQYRLALSSLAQDKENTELQLQVEQAEDNLRALIRLEEGAKKYGLEVESLSAQSQRLAEAYNLTAEEAAKLAIQNRRMEKGVEKLADNWDDWKKVLKSTDKLTGKYADAVSDCTDAIADLVGASDDLELPDDFFNDKNMKLIEKAIQGDTDAINELGLAVGKATIEGLEFNSSLSKAINSLEKFGNEPIDITLGADQFELDKDRVLQGIQDIQNGVINAGSAMDAEWVAALNRLALSTGMTVEQMNGLLGSLGVQAKVETSYHEMPIQVPTYTEHQEMTQYNPAQKDELGNIIKPATWSTRKYTVPGEPINVNGYVAVAQISTEDNPLTVDTSTVGTKPAATYTGNRGSYKAPPSTGSGGGGGGGASKPTGTKKDNSEKERYRSIKNVLEDLTAEYEKISKAADRAFGKERIKLLQQQEAELRALAASQRLYLEQIEDYLASDKASLQQVADFAQVSIKYNADGTIINYDEIQNAMYKDYNSRIDAEGNVIGMDEEAWEKYEEQWDNMMELIDQYEETQDLRKEALQQLQDYINELYDLRLEKVTYAVEIDIDAKDFQLEFLDSLLERVRDDAWEAAEAIELMGEKAATMLEKNETYHSGIRDILMNHTTDILDANGNVLKAADLTEADVAGYFAGDPAVMAKLEEMGKNGGFTADEVDKLKEYHEALIELSDDMLLLREDVYQIALDAFEQFGEEMDEIIEKMEHLISITQHYKNIVDIVGKKNLGISNDLLETVGQSIVTQSTNQLEASRIRKETIADEIRAAEEKLQLMRDQGLEEDAKLWEDNLKVMYESLREAEEEFMSSWENTMEVINEQFELMVSNVSETFSDMLAGPMRSSLEQLQDAFDRQNDLNSLHLDDYEKIYTLSKLNRDIINSIDETDNIKAKEELAKLQEEINKLEEDGVKVSEYQTEDLRRRYELRLAELALIEAQNVKSNVRMDRDADGNWNYVYTADEEAVRSAEQNYEDKLFALQEANTEYIREMENLILQSQIELQQKIEEITMDETLSMEEKYALIQEYTDYYSQKIAEYSSEMELALNNNKWLYEEEWTKYSQMTGYKISAEQTFIDKFSETVLSQTTGFKTLGDLNTNYETATSNMLTNLATAFNTWKGNVDTAMKAAGTSVNSFGSDMSKMVESITKEGGLSDTLLKDMQSLSSDIKTEFQNIADAVADWAKAYSKKIDDAIAKNDALVTSFANLIAQWSKYKEVTSTPPVNPPPATQPVEEQKPGSNNNNNNNNNNNTNKGGSGGKGGTDTTTTTNTVTISYVSKTNNDSSDGGGRAGCTISKGATKLSDGEATTVKANPAEGWNYSFSSSGAGASVTGSGDTRTIRCNGSGHTTITVTWSKKTTVKGKGGGPEISTILHSETGGLVGGERESYKRLLRSYDTGGYTGSWGKEGRMAMLHEKELVLNKEDTKNMLKSVGIIRRIAEVIDLNALASSGATSRGRLQGQFVKELEGFEQNVHIEANFPNATDKNEIYEAFNEMINMAVQYANRK